MVLLTCWYSFLSSLYLSAKLLTRFIIMVLLLYDIFTSISVFVRQVGDSTHHYGITYFMIILSSVLCIYIRQVGDSVQHYGILYDILSSILCIYQASSWLYSLLWYYFMIFFPQLSVFIRQVGDSVHHYGITYWYFFLSSLYLSGKLVTVFIIMALLSLWYYFLSSLYYSGKLVTLFIIMVFLTLWYSFLSSLYLSGKLVALFIIMVLIYDSLSSVLCIYQASWWLYNYYRITYFMIFFPQFPVFIRQVGDSVHHYGYYLLYDIFSSVLCIYQTSCWLYSSVWHYTSVPLLRYSF